MSLLGNKTNSPNAGFMSASNLTGGGATFGKQLNTSSTLGGGLNTGNVNVGNTFFNKSTSTGLSGTSTGGLGNTSTGGLGGGLNTNTPSFGAGNTSNFLSQSGTGNSALTGIGKGQNTGMFGTGGISGTTNLFGGASGTSQTAPIYGGGTTGVPTTGTSSFFAKPQSSTSTFLPGATGIQGIGMTSGTGTMYNQSPPNNQVLTLSPTNFLKYEKVGSLNDEIKRVISQIELEFKNNEIFLDYTENLIKLLIENYKVVTNEGVKVIKFCKLINSKNSKIKYIVQTLRNEIDMQNELLDKERKNYHVIEHHPTMKISIPSDYFINLTKEIEEKITLQIQQISDLEALVNLYYRKEYGTFKVNSDIIEELIRELYNCLISLVSEAARINEYVIIIKNSYVEMMKKCYGWNDYEIENRIRSNILINEEEKFLNKERSFNY